MNTKTATSFKVFTSKGATEYPTQAEAITAAQRIAKRAKREIVVTQDQHTPGYYDGVEVARWTVTPAGVA